MISDDPLTLPMALWSRLRREGLFFSLQVNAQEPDVWRFRFAPLAELHVTTDGQWAWRGVAGRARRVVLPLVAEAEAWLDQARRRAAESARTEARRPGAPRLAARR